MLIRKVVTMAKVIEPIAHLYRRILGHNTTTTAAYNAFAFRTTIPPNFANCQISSSPSGVGNVRWLSTSSTHKCMITYANAGEICESSLTQTSTKKRQKSPKKKSVPKPKTPIDPEKLKRAQAAKKLHQMNKDMFGELLESSKQKSQRVKKEAKTARKLLGAPTQKIPTRGDEYYLNPNLDPTAGIEFETDNQNEHQPLRMISSADSNTRSSKAPKFLPIGEKIKIPPRPNLNLEQHLSELSSSSQKHSSSSSYRKEAEINWMLKTTPGMTKVLKGNFYNDPSSLAANASKTSATRSQSQIQSTSKSKIYNKNETEIGLKESNSRGAKAMSSFSPSPGQLRADVAVNMAQNRMDEEFLKSIFKSSSLDEFRPRSEVVLVKRQPENIEMDEELKSHTLEHPIHLLTKKDFINGADEAIKDDDDLSETKSFSQESKNPRNSISITPTTNNTQEKNHNQIFDALTPRVDQSTKQYHDKADKVQSNVYNQGNPSIIISVPYFNPDRVEDAAFFQRNQDPNLDQSSSSYSNSCTETNSFIPSNSSGAVISKNQIISIPFPRFSRFTDTKGSNDEGSNSSIDLQAATTPQPQLPSVSKILNKTMPKEQQLALERWQAKMILQMGEEGFRLYKENMLNNGKMLHSNIENFLGGTPLSQISVAESILGHWNSLTNILPVVEDVLVLESRVVHPTLKYCGIVDCVAIYKNRLVVIDWKTSQKQKPIVSMTYDTPIQIAAYIGAINYDPNYSLKITEGLIVIAYEDGKTGHTFLLKPEDVAKYWDKWTRRLKMFYALNETENSN